MSPRALTAAMLTGFLAAVCADEPVQFDAATTTVRPPEMPRLPRWEIPVEESGLPPIRLGKSDYVITGPLVDTFRPRLDPPRTLGRKILALPVVNMFVPAPWPKPGPTKYFAWGERDVPWSVTAERQRPGPSGVLVAVGH